MQSTSSPLDAMTRRKRTKANGLDEKLMYSRNHHLIEAGTSDSNDAPTSKVVKASRDSLMAHASLLQSTLALEKGDAQHALLYSGNCAGVLFQRWQKLETFVTSRSLRDDEFGQDDSKSS